jgi:hypothetical protein
MILRFIKFKLIIFKKINLKFNQLAIPANTSFHLTGDKEFWLHLGHMDKHGGDNNEVSKTPFTRSCTFYHS